MTEPHDSRDDERLAELLSDAVSDVEPANRLDDIRSRTRNGTKVTSMSSRRPWLFAVGGAVVATAAVITAIAAAGGTLPGMAADDDQSPANQPTHHATKEPRPDDASSPTGPVDEPAAPEQVVGVYFAGDTPQGQRLYREFQRDSDGTDPLLYAVDTSVTGAASDPDYHSLWPSGVSVTSATYDGNGTITVVLDGAPEDRPAGMSRADARVALQQVVYSAQAGLGQGRVPVQVEGPDGPMDTMLGEPASDPLPTASALQVLSLVSLSTPSEGETVSGDTLKVEGVANSFEANVVVRLQRWEGTEIVDQEPFTASGYMADKLFPFSGTIDISKVPPGDYVLMAMTDDPSGGEGGGGSFSDTRRITIE
jgi:hypothetical protein